PGQGPQPLGGQGLGPASVQGLRRLARARHAQHQGGAETPAPLRARRRRGGARPRRHDPLDRRQRRPARHQDDPRAAQQGEGAAADGRRRHDGRAHPPRRGALQRRQDRVQAPRVLLLPQLRLRLHVEEQPSPLQREVQHLGRDPQIQQGLQADLRRRRDDEPLRDPAAGRQRRIQQRGGRRRVAAAADQRVSEVRVDQPRAARRVGLPPEHRGDPATDEPAHVPAHLARARRSHATARQMTRRAPDRLRAGRFEVAWGATLLRALVGSLVALALGGCAMLPFFGDKKDDAEKAEPLVEQYDIEVDAPAPLKTLLLEYLDVSRFQKAPRSEAVTSSELDRLAAVVPAQAKTLLETEGYFSADVTIARSDPPGALPLLKITVVPGPRVEVARVAIDATAPLAPHQPSREEPWGDRLDHIRSVWPLKPGQPFRQPAWSAAKTSTLAAMRADAYPTATWKETHALVDATANTAALDLTLEPGPLYHLGEIRVQGISRFDETAVRRLATFFPGAQHSERLLLDYQDRLLKLGLFEGASVEVDTSGSPDAAPVIVKVKELTQH